MSLLAALNDLAEGFDGLGREAVEFAALDKEIRVGFERIPTGQVLERKHTLDDGSSDAVFAKVD